MLTAACTLNAPAPSVFDLRHSSSLSGALVLIAKSVLVGYESTFLITWRPDGCRLRSAQNSRLEGVG